MQLSVIVCTRNRAHVILHCLDSIATSLAHAAPVDAEIVVVDNGSEDNTSAIVRDWAESCAYPVNLLFEPRRGLAVAANCAVRAAKGDLFTFTDDDCRMSVEYVTDLLRHDAADVEPIIRSGRIELGDPNDLPITINTSGIRKRWSRKMRSARHDYLVGSIHGCNMAMRRSVIERLGPFDELFSSQSKIPSCDDADYLFRAYLSGLTIEYVPDMVVFHHHGRKTAYDGNRLFRNYMIGTGALYAKYIFKHPDFCRPFYWDFKKAIKEFISGKNTYLPDIDFSRRDKVMYNMLGAVKYFGLKIKKSR